MDTLQLSRLDRFCQIRLPQVIEQISVKRQQYLSVMNRIEARSQDAPIKLISFGDATGKAKERLRTPLTPNYNLSDYMQQY